MNFTNATLSEWSLSSGAQTWSIKLPDKYLNMVPIKDVIVEYSSDYALGYSMKNGDLLYNVSSGRYINFLKPFVYKNQMIFVNNPNWLIRSYDYFTGELIWKQDSPRGWLGNFGCIGGTAIDRPFLAMTSQGFVKGTGIIWIWNVTQGDFIGSIDTTYGNLYNSITLTCKDDNTFYVIRNSKTIVKYMLT